MKTVIIADSSFGRSKALRHDDLAEILVERIARRSSLLLKPDMFAILGDFSLPSGSKALERLKCPCKTFPDIKASGLSLRKEDVPALCEEPFSYLVLEEGRPLVRENLAMPKELALHDFHVHSSLAYCSENMDIAKSVRLAKLFGLSGLTFTEHSAHLYFNHKNYHSGVYLDPLAKTSPEELRMERYFKDLDDAGIPFVQRGLEIDSRFDGSPLAEKADLERVHLRIGAVHALRTLQDPASSMKDCMEEFLRVNTAFISSGIHILAHPFRVFRRANRETPHELFRPLAELLRKNNVAAELNFHTNFPPVEFLRLCLEEGVKTSFGSDSHNLCEIGEFEPQLRLLREAGFNGPLSDIMFKN